MARVSSKRLAWVAFASSVLAVVATTGCSPRRAPDDDTITWSRALEDGGVATTAAAPEIAAVGLLDIRFGGGLSGGCSGTLIAPRVVLTAAHCVFPGAMGCDLRVGPATVRFADANGDPAGAGGQTINVVGIAAHPDAYGNRVSGCADPVPAPTACPDATLPENATAFTTASCGLLKACFPTGYNAIPCTSPSDCGNRDATFNTVATMNFRMENDIALMFLESAPVGITPLPVLTQGHSSPNDGIFDADASVFTPWLDGNPLVTIAGYGQGRKPAVTRDVGTMTLVAKTADLFQGFDCAGASLGVSNEALWTLTATALDQANSVHGDSGGPMLFGSGPVPAGVPAPSVLPAGSGLTERRYVVGVNSTGGGTSAGDASLFNPENAQWLVNSLKDFDNDGVLNENDNCVGVANPDQANCNDSAEVDRGGRVLGDACDPVPCPSATVPYPLLPPASACSINTVNVLRNKINVTPIASHNSFNGVSVTDPDVPTRFRFCQANLARGSTCGLAEGQRTAAAIEAQNPDGTPPNNWLPMTMTTLPPDQEQPLNYPSATQTFTWNYTADRSRWIAVNQISTPPSTGTGIGGLAGLFGNLPLGPLPAGLSGVLAIRGSTTLGSGLRAQNGVHPSTVGVIGSEMARFYTEITPETRIARLGNCRAYDPLWRVRCPACARTIPRFADCPACSVGRLPTDDWWRARTLDPLVTIPGVRNRWGLIDSTGDFVLPPSAFSPNLVKELAGSLGTFVPRTEVDATKFGTVLPTSTATGPIQGAFISLDGRTIRGIVRASTLGYHLDGESFADVGTTPESAITVAVPNGATVANLAVASLGGALKLGDRSVVITSAGAPAKAAGLFGGTTDVGVDARVGDLFSTGDVELRDRARVTGGVTTEGALRLHNGNVVTGTIRQQTALNPLDSAWAAHIPTATQGPVMIEPDNSPRALVPGSFAAVHIKSRSTLQLRAGAYYMDSLFVEPQAVLDIDNRNGPVTIYLRQGLTFRGTTVERNPALANVLFVARGGDPIPLEAPFRGTLIAPNAAVTLATVGPAGHTGAFFARAIEVAPDVTVRQRPFTRPDCGDAEGCLGGWETSGTSAPRTVALGIAARNGFATVLHAKLQALYVIGGRLNAGGALTGAIVRHRLDLGTTSTLTIPGYAPGDVLAATANTADGSLWILDRVAGEGGTFTRLTRVDPIGRRFRTVWEGTESGTFDGHWLASGASGDVLLFSSSQAQGRYTTIRVKTPPFVYEGETFRLIANTPGVLAGLPIARGSGTIGYVLERSDGRLDRVDVPDSAGTEVADLAPWL